MAFNITVDTFIQEWRSAYLFWIALSAWGHGQYRTVLWETVITRYARWEMGGQSLMLRAQELHKSFPIHLYTLCSCEYTDISTHGNMPKIRDSLRSWAKPQHSSARHFSSEASALLATCIQLSVFLCSLNGEKDFVQGAVDTGSNSAVMSSSARTPQDVAKRPLLHILNQYCGKLFLPSNTTQKEVSEGGGLGKCTSMASMTF